MLCYGLHDFILGYITLVVSIESHPAIANNFSNSSIGGKADQKHCCLILLYGEEKGVGETKGRVH